MTKLSKEDRERLEFSITSLSIVLKKLEAVDTMGSTCDMIALKSVKRRIEEVLQNNEKRRWWPL